MLKTETKTIDGETYRATQLPYRKGQGLMIRLYRVLGPALSEGLSKIPQGGIDKMPVSDLIPSAAAIVNTLADKLSEDDFGHMVDLLAANTEVSKDGDRWVKLSEVIDLQFAGKYWHMMRWLVFALRLNYSDFLGARDALSGLLARAATASPSPTE